VVEYGRKIGGACRLREPLRVYKILVTREDPSGAPLKKEGIGGKEGDGNGTNFFQRKIA